jgi:hypothetical protein
MNPILAVRLLIVLSDTTVTLSPRCRFVIATFSGYRVISEIERKLTEKIQNVDFKSALEEIANSVSQLLETR